MTNYHWSYIVQYRKIPNISPEIMEVRKHFWGGLIFGGGGFFSGEGLILGGYFVLVSKYQVLKIHCYISLL